jgi:hypothetical protein
VDKNWQSTVVREAHLAMGANRQARRPNKSDSEVRIVQGKAISTQEDDR